jgi:acyl carrier protein
MVGKIMSSKSVTEQVVEVLKSHLPHVPNQNFTADADLFELGIDSISAVNVILDLQAEFGLTFDMDEINFENFQTIAGMVSLVELKQ